MPTVRIAIIGAGPAGLTLARLLLVSGTPLDITIFEKDASPNARQHVGGTLDLHEETGLKALRTAGLWEEFKAHARYDGEALVIADKNATRLIDLKGGEKEYDYARPEIDRESLKRILFDSLPPGCVRWGWKLTSVSESGRLVFEAKGEQGPFDLVVGADGAWSKVRPVLTNVRPTYSGIGGFELRIPNPDQNCPELSAMVGRGSYFAYSDKKSMTGQRMENNSIKIGTWVVCPEGTSRKLVAEHGNEGAKAVLEQRYTDWAPGMRDWIKHGLTESLQPWDLYELPVGHTWEHKPGFTLMGDAAHLMTPFAGEGVNTAMKDALELSDAIVASQKDGGSNAGSLDDAVQLFEKSMFPRAAAVQAQTFTNKTLMFKEDAPLGFLTHMTQRFLDQQKDTRWGKVTAFLPLLTLTYYYFWLRMRIGALTRRAWG